MKKPLIPTDKLVSAASEMLVQTNPYNPFAPDDTEFDNFVKLLQHMKEIDKMRFDYIGEDGKSQTFETRSGLKIITHHVYPPIPDRRWDWQAVFEDYEPGCLIGEGATEEEAKMDLLFQYYDGDQHG